MDAAQRLNRKKRRSSKEMVFPSKAVALKAVWVLVNALRTPCFFVFAAELSFVCARTQGVPLAACGFSVFGFVFVVWVSSC